MSSSLLSHQPITVTAGDGSLLQGAYCLFQTTTWVIWKPDTYEFQMPMWARNCPL